MSSACISSSSATRICAHTRPTLCARGRKRAGERHFPHPDKFLISAVQAGRRTPGRDTAAAVTADRRRTAAGPPARGRATPAPGPHATHPARRRPHAPNRQTSPHPARHPSPPPARHPLQDPRRTGPHRPVPLNSLVGDVVVVKNSGDGTIAADNGLNGWNMPWSEWKAGSAR
ncbi:hypothetical protein GUY61_02530 [Streptomyces sp. GC420]|nr:hypothetical protein [Streptomyces sp. GC420]